MNQTVLQWTAPTVLMLALGIGGMGGIGACGPSEPAAVGSVSASQAGDSGSGLAAGPDAGSSVASPASEAGAADAAQIVIIDTGAGTSADSDGGMTRCATSQVQADITKVIQPADIIIAIDSSGSMNDEIKFVQTQMNAFSQQIVASGIDARVILIGQAKAICIGAPLGAGSCPADSKLPGYLHVDRKVDSHDALNIILQTYPMWSAQLRPAASKSFVVISDDEATSTPNNSAAAFTTNLAALDAKMFAKWSFNGIFVLADCALGARVGKVYADLVNQTKGVSGDLCLQDFQPVFDRLSKQIIMTSMAELACNWAIPEPPAGEKLDYERVNIRYTDMAGVEASLGKVPSEAECAKFQNGWYYDDDAAPTTVIACPQSCKQMRASGVSKVEVVLGCKSEPAPVLN